MQTLSTAVALLGTKARLLLGASAMALAVAGPVAASPAYKFQQTLAIPGGVFSGYDFATFDASNQLYYLTDRSNNGIDVFNAATNAYVERIGAGLFSGATPSNNNAGPNGISISNVTGGKLLLAGNGPSTVISFNLDTTGLVVQGSARATSTAVAGTPTPPNRVDGVAYSPTKDTILAANNASTPGFVTLINNATGVVIKAILLDGTGGYPNVGGNGVEATIFNTTRGTFFVAVPALNAAGTGAGGVIELDAANGNLLNTYDFNAMGLAGVCSPTGIVQGSGASMLVACSYGAAGHSVILNPAGAGSLTIVAGISGGDQTAYDPSTNTFFEAARFQQGGPVLGVIDASTLAVQLLAIGGGDHSVAVDPISHEVFVATAPTTTFPGCASGCIGVFAVNVPEPASLPLMAMALSALGIVTLRRRT